jgi:hypothetical protein
MWIRQTGTRRDNKKSPHIYNGVWQHDRKVYAITSRVLLYVAEELHQLLIAHNRKWVCDHGAARGQQTRNQDYRR